MGAGVVGGGVAWRTAADSGAAGAGAAGIDTTTSGSDVAAGVGTGVEGAGTVGAGLGEAGLVILLGVPVGFAGAGAWTAVGGAPAPHVLAERKRQQSNGAMQEGPAVAGEDDVQHRPWPRHTISYDGVPSTAIELTWQVTRAGVNCVLAQPQHHCPCLPLLP